MYRLFLVSLFCLPLFAFAEDKPSTESKERKAVKAWLKENTDSGEWEEVKWWGPIQPYKNEGIKTQFLRLKYRTESSSGSKTLHDDVFSYDGTRAKRHRPDHDFPAVYRYRLFFFEGDKSEGTPSDAKKLIDDLKNLGKPRPKKAGG